MSFEFFGRLQKELSFTGSAVYESVVAVAERVNRKVHVLRLHGQAASLLTQIDTVEGDLGKHLADAFSGHAAGHLRPSPADVEQPLNQAADRVHVLKQTLVQVDAQIRALKLEAIQGDLLTLQRDLSLRGAGIEPDPAWIAEAAFDAQSGRRAMRSLLGRADIEAVFVASDVVAFGAIDALRAAGKRIPQDVSIVGFDDIPLAAFLDPPLTTVRLPAYELGHAAGPSVDDIAIFTIGARVRMIRGHARFPAGTTGTVARPRCPAQHARR